ncbi:HAD-IIB family hydrolase [Streptomyces sp. NPDC002285]
MMQSVPSSKRYLCTPQPGTIQCAVFTDFDETYLAHSQTPEIRRTLQDLEDFLSKECERRGILIGWVTGSSLQSVMSKVDQYELSILPHFIASSLGAELVHFENGVARSDSHWQHRISAGGYSTQTVLRLVRELAGSGIILTPQPSWQPGELMQSFYYEARSDTVDRRTINAVRGAALRCGIQINFARCNPQAGDPPGFYDVDFFPAMCGKKSVMRYLCKLFRVPLRKVIAFGDSEGDVEMLQTAGSGILVANSTDDAKKLYPRVSNFQYAGAILDVLKHQSSVVEIEVRK